MLPWRRADRRADQSDTAGGCGAAARRTRGAGELSARVFRGSAVLVAFTLFACSDGSGNNETSTGDRDDAAEENETKGDGETIRIAFSAPGADHGWLAAITENARDEAEELGDVELI